MRTGGSPVPDLVVTRTGDPTAPIHADRTRVNQIVSNLVDNARRHTPPGGQIVLDVRRSTQSASPRAELTVTDSGPGSPTPTANASSIGSSD